jgi:hypothetical protein
MAVYMVISSSQQFRGKDTSYTLESAPGRASGL